MAFNALLPFVFLSFIILVVSLWNYVENDILDPIEKELDSGYLDKNNINVAYLYVHKESGELKVESRPRKAPVAEHSDKNWEVIDIWWETPSE